MTATDPRDLLRAIAWITWPDAAVGLDEKHVPSLDMPHVDTCDSLPRTTSTWHSPHGPMATEVGGRHGHRGRAALPRCCHGAGQCGEGRHVVRGVVVCTDGRLWARRQVGDLAPQRDVGAWGLEVEPPSGRTRLPHPVEYDGLCLHTVRRVSEVGYMQADFIDRLMDGCARVPLLDHRRRS